MSLDLDMPVQFECCEPMADENVALRDPVRAGSVQSVNLGRCFGCGGSLGGFVDNTYQCISTLNYGVARSYHMFMPCGARTNLPCDRPDLSTGR